MGEDSTSVEMKDDRQRDRKKKPTVRMHTAMGHVSQRMILHQVGKEELSRLRINRK